MPGRHEQYERRFAVVREIINRHDPAQLFVDRTRSWNGEESVPFDRRIDNEYASEVKGVLSIIEKANPDERKLRERVVRLFETMLGPGQSRSTDWDALVGELWRASQGAGW